MIKKCRVTTYLENHEMSGNFAVVREELAFCQGNVREKILSGKTVTMYTMGS